MIKSISDGNSRIGAVAWRGHRALGGERESDNERESERGERQKQRKREKIKIKDGLCGKY